ncbi:MAG: DinB family protein [Candidatus Eisenbacteria bacterium]|uniref:DinB family protein n=1 Tax=Eiseniibacteriota bacterium TaxID=2212470 RepID=A0A538T0J6_UNCEI|nr:MAG: DinB family protein [Candidatus Eisenbacteria bacterium]
MKETQDAPLRAQLKKLLGWEDAHVGFEAAVEGVGPAHQGKTPPGLPFSPWQLLEHLRITQFDILDFCRNSAYKERAWPKDYWPPAPGPPSPSAWKESVAAFQRDRAALQKLAEDPSASGRSGRIAGTFVPLAYLNLWILWGRDPHRPPTPSSEVS